MILPCLSGGGSLDFGSAYWICYNGSAQTYSTSGSLPAGSKGWLVTGNNRGMNRGPMSFSVSGSTVKQICSMYCPVQYKELIVIYEVDATTTISMSLNDTGGNGTAWAFFIPYA